MDQDLQSRLKYELKLLEAERMRQVSRLQELDSYRDILLKRIVPKKGRGNYYYAKVRGSDKFKYIGSGCDQRILRVKEAAHLTKSIRRIDNNIALITSLINGYTSYDYDSVDNDLPLAYRNNGRPSTSAYQLTGLKWKKEKLIYQAGFPENFPEHKTETTSDDVKVKTVSELVLYERLKSAGLIFVYELPMPCIDYGPNLYPDFTVLSPVDLKTEIIVEYVGRLDMPNYRLDFAKRIHRYMQNGYIPGVNLFFVFGDLKGHVDSLQISKVLADITGVR